jgi:integrase
MAATEPIRNKSDIRKLTNYYLKKGLLRNHLLVVMGLHTALRISDLLRLRFCDVTEEDGSFKACLTLTEKKTGKVKTIALHQDALRALRLYADRLGKSFSRGDFIFASPKKPGTAICRTTAWRIVRAAARALAIAGTIACHSLRKTFGYHAWKGGASPVVLMDIFNHASYATTRRYLGVSQDDRNKIYLGMSLG